MKQKELFVIFSPIRCAHLSEAKTLPICVHIDYSDSQISSYQDQLYTDTVYPPATPES